MLRLYGVNESQRVLKLHLISTREQTGMKCCSTAGKILAACMHSVAASMAWSFPEHDLHRNHSIQATALTTCDMLSHTLCLGQ